MQGPKAFLLKHHRRVQMKLLHISDLHIGKRVNSYSMIEDQKYILDQILQITDRERPDAVLVAGDVYDKSVPSEEAVDLFDWFLVRLVQRKQEVFVVSGNHDSAERLSFAHKIMDACNVHFSPVYEKGAVSCMLHEGLKDEVRIHLLPFVKPANVRAKYPEETIDSYTGAVSAAVSHMDIDKEKVNILVAHQFVTGAERCDSEEISVGGLDNVDASAFADFDYVALGHLHGPQSVSRDTIRYAGSPLKYSFSEEKQHKSVTLVEIAGKGAVSVREAELKPQRDMVTVRGTFNELMAKDFYESGTLQDDYVRVILTDEDDIPDAMTKLRTVYRNVMELRYDNMRTRNNVSLRQLEEIEALSPQKLFSDFYAAMNGQEMSREQEKIVDDLVKKIWEEK